MNSSVFLSCLGANGFSTGTQVVGLFNLQSGDKNFVFNQLYSTGFNYVSGYPFESAIPLLYEGTGTQPSGVLIGSQPYQIGDGYNNDFGVLLMLQNSGCLNTGNLNKVLISTTSSGSGAILGLTPSNRLFLNLPNYTITLSQEVDVADFAFLSVQQNRFCNFGVFSIKNNQFYRGSYDYGYAGIPVQNLFIGGLLNYPSMFTGYSGIINEIYLFNGNINDNFLNPCINCVFATGYGYTTPTSLTFNDTQITGSVWSGVTTITTTGSQIVSGNYIKTSGSGIIYLVSGISGTTTLYQSLVPLTTSVPYTVYSSGTTLLYNTGQIINGTYFNVYFGVGLTSGDIVESYAYQLPQQNLSQQLSYNNQYPVIQNVQLFGNGLAETFGIDFTLSYGNYINGFDSNDKLLYDVYPTPTITMPYVTSGYISTGISGAGYILITGISGINISGFNYDIYLNGQKMISGVNYSYTAPSSLYVSGNDLVDINDPSGDILEIKFVPLLPNLLRSLYEISGSGNFISGLYGFNEQIWLNGLRQTLNIDYWKINTCPFCTGIYLDPDFNFNLYNSVDDTINLFDIPAP